MFFPANILLKCNVNWCTNNAFRHLFRFQTFYAGLIVCFVPICDTDSRLRLTYENIFNNTKYAQIPHRRQPTLNYSNIRPHIQNSIDSVRDFSVSDTEVDDKKYNKHKNDNDQLLVGFSYDPYRFSVPEVDYIKGVRSYQPQSSMDMMKTERGKRGVAHLYNMIYCATGCEPLNYKGYGCYCGFLGSGRATDGIDRCCKMHDQCYENLYCPFFTVYFQPYYWKCHRGEPLCALENHATRHQLINGCAGQLCECDRKLAMCLRRYRCPRSRPLCRSSPLRLLQNVLMAR